MVRKILFSFVITILLCAARPVKVNLFGMADNIAYIVSIDDSTFVQIAPSNRNSFYFLADADSGAVIRVVSGYDTTITDIARPDGATVHVYPNPSADYIAVDTKSHRVFDLFNVAGQSILSLPLKQGTTILKLPPLASGVYFWRVGTTTGKLTILH